MSPVLPKQQQKRVLMPYEFSDSKAQHCKRKKKSDTLISRCPVTEAISICDAGPIGQVASLLPSFLSSFSMIRTGNHGDPWISWLVISAPKRTVYS
jgi:hypothetical protein